MNMKNYLILCAGISVSLVLCLLYLPGFGDTVEQIMLGFLAANAR